MAQNRDKLDGFCTLERIKLDYCRYDYFIADRDANRIIDIDSKFYNCTQIGKTIGGGALEYEYIDPDEKEVEREYDTNFRYFEFCYDIITPKYEEVYRVLHDHIGEYRELMSEFELSNYDYENEDEDNETEIVEKGNEKDILKAIITDAGDLIIDELKEVVKFIPEFELIIVQLYINRNSKWWTNYSKYLFHSKRWLFN
jgi:hypothetical protein